MGRCTGLCLTRSETGFFKVLPFFDFHNRVCALRPCLYDSFQLSYSSSPRSVSNVYLVLFVFLFLNSSKWKITHTHRTTITTTRIREKNKNSQKFAMFAISISVGPFSRICVLTVSCRWSRLSRHSYSSNFWMCACSFLFSLRYLLLCWRLLSAHRHTSAHLSLQIYKRTIYIYYGDCFRVCDVCFAFLGVPIFILTRPLSQCVCSINIDVSVCVCVFSVFPVHWNVSLSHSRCLSVVSPGRVWMLLVIPCCCGCSVVDDAFIVAFVLCAFPHLASISLPKSFLF